MRRIAHNLIIDSFRQEKSENLVSCDEPEVNILNNIGLAEGTIENAIVNRQILSDVRRLMEFLPDEQREVVYMRFYQEPQFQGDSRTDRGKYQYFTGAYALCYP